MASSSVLEVVQRNQELRQEKTPWNNSFQIIGEYVMLRKQQFTTEHTPGEFLTDQLFDSTGPFSAQTMASSLLGALWPNGAKSMRIVMPDGMEDSETNRDYYTKVTERMASHMDNAKSGLMLALSDYMGDQSSFGTSGLGVFKGPSIHQPLIYEAWDVKGMSIDEGRNGLVDTVYNQKTMTIRKAAKIYGADTLSAKSREALKNGKGSEKIQILHAVQPRLKFDPATMGNTNKPWESVHIELGVNKRLRASGFDEMPIMVGRFIKAMGEKYGRSSGFYAIPDIIELNVIWEALTVAAEKQLDPPLAVLDDGRLGGGTIDTSAGAINVFNASGRISSQNPIFPLFTVGEFREAKDLVEKLMASISQAFFLDRLLDLNNQTQMTAFETSVRDKLRGQSLSSLFIRQEVELFTPMIERTFNILLDWGILGVRPESKEEQVLLDKGIVPLYIPDDVWNIMTKGGEAYKIQYISPAKRLMQAEEVRGIFTTFEFALTNSNIAPDMIDNLDTDKSVRRMSQLTGVSEDVLNSLDFVKKTREARGKLIEEQAKLETADKAADIGLKTSQAQSTKAGAGAS